MRTTADSTGLKNTSDPDISPALECCSQLSSASIGALWAPNSCSTRKLHHAVKEFAGNHQPNALMTFTNPNDPSRSLCNGTLRAQLVPAISLGSKQLSSSM